MKIDSLEKLFIDQLRDLYSAETQLVKALPKMAKAASSEELKKAFQSHLEETKGQVQRLDRIFKERGGTSKGKKCKAMEGLIAEGEELMKEDIEPDLLDVGLIAAAQKVEHYEIAGYGSVRAFATMLGHNDAADLLQETLDEEHGANDKLNQIATETVNEQALEGGEKAKGGEDEDELAAEDDEEVDAEDEE